VPFRKNWKDEHGQYQVTLECQLIIGYQGLVELVMNTGLVSTIHADIVCDNDLFSYDLGEITRHSIDFRRDRGPAFAAYTRVVFKDGSISCCVMSRQEIEAVRARSKVRNGPWDTDWAEMAKKTTFRRLAKWLPFRSEDLRRVDDMEVADFEEPGSRPQRPTVEVDLAQFLPSTDPNRGPERALPESPVKRKPEEEEMIEQLRRQARQQYDNQQKTRAQLPDLETFPKAELYPVGTMIKVGGAFYVRNVDGSEEEWESLPERQEIEQ
jgi:recombinational DNA repair protein RecT